VRGCTFIDCDFRGTNLSSAVLESTAMLQCQFGFTTFLDTQLRGCKLTGSTFAKQDLSLVNVSEGDWSLVSMRECNLRGLDLRRVRLTDADLGHADLRNADLRLADLSGANLDGARLRGVDLRGAHLERIGLASLQLKGIRIDLQQAALIVTALGARVEDAD